MLLVNTQRVQLDRLRLAELVAERLGEWIMEQQLKPGDRLPSEPELAAHFGVARTVVREALSKLRALGVIEVHQGKGAFVAALPLELLFMRIRRLDPRNTDVSHVQDLHQTLETRIAELAAERRTRDDLRLLENALQRIQTQKSEDQIQAAVTSFHHHLARAAHNPVFEQLLTDLLGLLPALTCSQSRSEVALNDERRAILEAVRAGNTELARTTMKLHLNAGSALESDSTLSTVL